eukprot:6500388-Pyramimonas_sp.AAC.1
MWRRSRGRRGSAIEAKSARSGRPSRGRGPSAQQLTPACWGALSSALGPPSWPEHAPGNLGAPASPRCGAIEGGGAVVCNI